MLSRLKKKIESAMFDGKQSDEDLTEVLLSGFSACYDKVMTCREILYRKQIKKSYALPCYVISVGNITAGGTGKTPMVIYLARLIKKTGLKPAVISRGYGGTASSEGGIVSNGKTLLMIPEKSGDEPYMIAEKLLSESVPVVIGSDRFNAGMTAVREFNPDVVILDDGFQHLKVKRDLDILLFDAKRPVGNGKMIPRGTLREPLKAMLRADIFVVTRVEKGAEKAAEDIFYRSVSDGLSIDILKYKPFFTSSHSPSVIGRYKPLSDEFIISEDIDTKIDVYAFSGIAKNDAFRKTAAGMGFMIKGYSEFPDHYAYTEKDCRMLDDSAKKAGVSVFITTEKDYVKLREFEFDFELIIIGVEIDFQLSEKRFSDLVKNRILKAKSGK